MKRLQCSIRPNWQKSVEDIGLTYHTHEHGPYWNEGVYYQFNGHQIDVLEEATNTLHEMCIEAASKAVEEQRFAELGIPAGMVPFVLQSWERDDFSLYGRFDLAYDGKNPPKMLEYNADTPTALVEASIAQWTWKEEMKPHADQFNSLHESLIAAFRKITSTLLHFTGVQDNLEDNQTIAYMMDCAIQAGLVTKWVPIDQVGYSDRVGDFIDIESDKILNTLFKLYPWEWLFNEPFAEYLNKSRVKFIEPGWKSLLSNKGLLPILWELYPDHELLLPAYRSPDKLGSTYVKKPILSREGSNITIIKNRHEMISTDGEYGHEGFIYQALADIPVFDGGFRPVIGSWIIDHYARGIGVREDTSLVTGNLSRFCPHCFVN